LFVWGALNETGSCETLDNPRVGPMGPNTILRFQWGKSPRFAKVLSRATGRALCHLGFSNRRPGQVANGLRLAARRAAALGLLRSHLNSRPAARHRVAGRKRFSAPVERAINDPCVRREQNSSIATTADDRFPSARQAARIADLLNRLAPMFTAKKNSVGFVPRIATTTRC
jgi:hypothetical protein